jgi:hypothetical protein
MDESEPVIMTTSFGEFIKNRLFSIIELLLLSIPEIENYYGEMN